MYAIAACNSRIFSFRNSVEMCVKLNGNCSVHLAAPSQFVPSIRVNDFGMNLSHNCEAKSLSSLKVFSHDAEIESEYGAAENVPCDLERLS